MFTSSFSELLRLVLPGVSQRLLGKIGLSSSLLGFTTGLPEHQRVQSQPFYF